MGAAPASSRFYQPDDLGRLATLTVVCHATEWSFPGPIFEAKINAGMAAFLETLEAPGNGWWPAELGGDYVGGMLINGNNADAALLCWFTPIDKARGQGIGRQQLDNAMDLCRAPGFPLDFLTTLRSLYTAPAFTSSPGSI